MALTRAEIISIAERFGTKVESILGSIEIRLFGSYLSGKFSDDSDIDLAVVGDVFENIGHLTALQILSRIKIQVDNRLDPIPLTPHELHYPLPGDIAFEISKANELLFATTPVNFKLVEI